MVVASSSRVAVDALDACFGEKVVHDVFGGWGTTDIAQTDEEDFCHVYGDVEGAELGENAGVRGSLVSRRKKI